jgi:hypothetical protein
MPRFYLTTAIDYVNNRPHLGTAYEKIAADVIARYKRLAGFDVHFVMGNDEHSQNVFKKAREAGLDPLAYCDQMEQEFRQVWRRLNLSFDDFIRTTQPRHRKAVETLVQRSFDTGDIYEGYYEGWYCVSCEEFKPEKNLVDGLCHELRWIVDDLVIQPRRKVLFQLAHRVNNRIRCRERIGGFTCFSLRHRSRILCCQTFFTRSRVEKCPNSAPGVT